MTDMRYTQIQMHGAAGTPAQHIDLNSLTVQAHFCPIMPTEIKMFALAINNAVAAAGIVLLKYRPTIGSTSGEVTVATINLATTHAAGHIVYKTGLDYTALPGGELVVEVTDVTGAGDLASAMLWARERYENPANDTSFVAST